MATLKYWIAECTDDNPCYSIIGKTKKEVQAKLNEFDSPYSRFARIEQREIDYRDAFDLFDWATSEGGGRACGMRIPKQRGG